jgi:lantibiotic modifying enzyme
MITLPSPDLDRRPDGAAGLPPNAALGRDEVLAAVREIAATLHERALSSDGRTLWLGDQVEPVGSDFRVVHGACGGSLYDGTAGIGWFLARAGAVTDDDVARHDALGALRHALDEASEHASLGLHDGIAGIGWAALDGGLALADPIAAEGLAVIIDAVERSVASPLPDELIGGRAGVILATLSAAVLARDRLDRPAEATRLDAAAITLGRQMLHSAQRSPTGWTWPSVVGSDDEPPLCGLGHGGSGPVLASAHLAALTGDPEFAEAAAEGARAERAWLGSDDGWPDLRGFNRSALERGERPPSPVLWCHGAVGIGLSRIRAARLLGDPALLADAGVALRLAARDVQRLWAATPGTYEANFSLCHGAAGLVELFVTAARELGDRAWLGAAAAVVRAGLAHAETGHGWTCGVRDGTESSSLMLGLAGTGAALLRLATAAGIPSPLLIGPDPAGARLWT